jgi:hypothetical protein
VWESFREYRRTEEYLERYGRKKPPGGYARAYMASDGLY